MRLAAHHPFHDVFDKAFYEAFYERDAHDEHRCPRFRACPRSLSLSRFQGGVGREPLGGAGDRGTAGDHAAYAVGRHVPA
ncbi:hypothetical protein [Streptomyces sp. NPDC127119]|uniref:hypothetical protein n=1 Tax=Streptomyces sp. NPDC127119 TaxID=3345370 RepID=UPI003643E771